jgi:hypothetical protein
LQSPPNRRFTAIIHTGQLCHSLAGSVPLGDAPALTSIECSHPAELLAVSGPLDAIFATLADQAALKLGDMMVSINLPTSEVVLHQLSPSETKPQPFR